MTTSQIFLIAGLFSMYYSWSDKGRPVDVILSIIFFVISYWINK